MRKVSSGDESPRSVDLQALQSVEVQSMFRHDFPPTPLVDEVSQQSIDDGIAALSDYCSDGAPIVAILPSTRAQLLRCIQLPPSFPTAKLDDLVSYELQQSLPLPTEEVTWRWCITGSPTIANGTITSGSLLVAAAKKTTIESSQAQCGHLRERVDLVTSEALLSAEFAALLALHEQTSELALLEMGAEASTLCVYSKRGVWLRSIPIGGAAFTRQISRDHKLTYAKAEACKLEYSTEYTSNSLDGSLHPVLEDLGTEIIRSLRYYDSMSLGPKIKKVIACGRSSALPGLSQILSRSSSKEVVTLESAGLAVPGLSAREVSDCGPLLIAAVQRLGFGDYRRNFLPNSQGFGLGDSEAIALKIGRTGIRALKLSRKA